MKKVMDRPPRAKAIILTIAAVLFILIVIIPLSLIAFDGKEVGNVALIPLEGIIFGVDGSGPFGQDVVSSPEIVDFLLQAEQNPQIKVIVLEINSPGGSAVASDEIAAAVKKTEKPVIAFIREVGASGGYWIASAADYILANRMSITGSIGVISSYLELSGLMEKYGVGYERLVAGEYKDMGTPYKELSMAERLLLQRKMNTIHDYFIKEVANNRKLSETKVRDLATGEFFLGVEAYNHGLVDALGNKDTLEEYLKQQYHLDTIDYVRFEKIPNLFDLFSGVLSTSSFHIGEGIGSMLLQRKNPLVVV